MLSSITIAKQRPANTRLHLTPLRVERDRGNFDRQMHSNAILIYLGGAGEAQAVGPLVINHHHNLQLHLVPPVRGVSWYTVPSSLYLQVMMTITYQRSLEGVNWSRLAVIIHEAGLGQAQADDLQRAFRNSDLYVFAFDGDLLIGAARMLSDGVYHAQLCEMVVMPTKQRQGVGSTMLEMLLHDLNGLKVLLTASFGKEAFYRKHGFRRHKTALAYNYGSWWYEDEAANTQAEPRDSATK